MMVRLFVHCYLKSLLHHPLEFFDVSEVVGGNVGIVDVNPNIHSASVPNDFVEQAGVRGRTMVTVLMELKIAKGNGNVVES